MKDRLFLGITVPEAQSIQLYRNTAQLAETQRLRLVPPRNYHVTVSFLGEVDQRESGRLRDGIRSVTEKTAPFTLYYKDVVPAPPSDPTKMIWANFEDSDPFRQFVEDIETELGNRDIAQTFRRHHEVIPHVTLARRGTGNTEPLIVPKFTYVSSEMPVDQCVLFKSVQLPANPIYTPIEIFRLNNTI